MDNINMFGILEKHSHKFHVYKIKDNKYVLDFLIPKKHQCEILGVRYFKKRKEILFIIKNKYMFSYDTSKKEFLREIKFPECFLDYTYSKKMNAIFCVGVSGKIYYLDMKMFYSQQWV